MAKGYLDFKDISEKVRFRQLLDWLNIGYTETRENEGTLKGQTDKFSFIITESKNLFLVPEADEPKGSPINFLAAYKGVDLRTAAKELKETFIKATPKPKREIPDLELTYCKQLEEIGLPEEFCKEHEIGWVKAKSIMSRKIAFLIRDENGDKKGYVGYDHKKDNWFFPKGFKRTMVYNLYRAATPYAILTTDLFDCAHIIKSGFPFTVSLMGKSATEEQTTLLNNRFQRILFLADNPENVRARLAKQSFVKTPELQKPVREMTAEEIKACF